MQKAIFLDHILTAQKQKNIPLESILETVKECGYTGVEIPCETLKSETLETLLSFGFEISSVVRYMEFQDMPQMEDITGFSESVRQIGCKTVMIVPQYCKIRDKSADFDKMCEGLSMICDIARDFCITVTMEDYDNIDIPCGGIDGISSFLKRVPALMHTFDTGNYEYFGDDVMRAFTLFKGRIAHVHIKDRAQNQITYGDEPTVSLLGKPLYPVYVGGGYLPVEKIIKELKGMGYSGYLTAEHFGASDELDYIIKSAQNLDKIIASVF